MIKQTNLTQCRMEFLKQFDYYVRNIIGNEVIIKAWLTLGLPDEYDETDLREIALDDELWIDCVECFGRCCRVAGVIE